MLQTLKLLIPALIPSWNFFDTIASSPRIEYARMEAPDRIAEGWREFRPRPQHLGGPGVLLRLIWNARWNEALFVVSCAERLLAAPTVHSQDEIFHRIAADLVGDGRVDDWLRFRIILVDAHDGPITRTVAFVSEPRRLADIPVR